MTDCISRLITSLREVEVHAHDDKGFISIHRGRNINNIRFWGTEEAWNFGYLRWPMEPTAALTTPDRDIALRWLICCTGNLYREKQEWPFLLPLRTISEFASGWTAEQTSEQTLAYSVKATGRLIRPDGTPVAMDMTTTFPHAPELAALSHLMHLTPDQVLDAYLTPNGEPLNHLLEHGDPVTNQGTDFKRMVDAHTEPASVHTEGFTIDWNKHFWLEDGCWHYGTTERSESRSGDISSPHQDLVLRWAAFETLNIFRRRKEWPTLFVNPHPVMATDWTLKKTFGRSCGTLISPKGTTLEMVMQTSFSDPWKLNVYSHLAPHTPEQIIDSFLLEDGGSFQDHLAQPTSP